MNRYRKILAAGVVLAIYGVRVLPPALATTTGTESVIETVVETSTEIVSAKATSFRMDPLFEQSTFFADQEQIFRFQVVGDIPPQGKVYWSLDHHARVIAQGEGRWAEPSDAEEGSLNNWVEIAIQFPPLKEGVILPLDFTLVLREPSSPTPLTLWEHRWYLFSKDPFAFSRDRMEERKIILYDPQGQTREMLAALDLPHEEIFNLDAMTDYETGLLIIGAGIDFEYAPGLMDKISLVLVQGTPVLLLAPSQGQMTLPNLSKLGAIQIILSGPAVIQRFDKRFDLSWSISESSVAAAVAVQEITDQIVGTWDPANQQWPWLEITLAGQPRFVACGLDLSGKINENPTPGYFLAQVIEDMTRE